LGKLMPYDQYYYRQVYRGEHTNPETGEKREVALKKLIMLHEKDGVRLFLINLIVSNHCYEGNQIP